MRVHITFLTMIDLISSLSCRPQYFNQLIASDSLLPYLKDNGEQNRVGTLLVYMDEGIASDVPLMALPINLSLLLSLPDYKAFIGFTSSTGRFYEKHDILSWTWCDQNPCDEQLKKNFDYHQESKFSSTVIRQFTPGAGFGGGDVDGFPTKNKSPGTHTTSCFRILSCYHGDSVGRYCLIRAALAALFCGSQLRTGIRRNRASATEYALLKA